jgi:hypothetical protein
VVQPVTNRYRTNFCTINKILQFSLPLSRTVKRRAESLLQCEVPVFETRMLIFYIHRSLICPFIADINKINSLQHDLSWKPNGCSLTQTILRLLRIPKLSLLLHTRRLLDPSPRPYVTLRNVLYFVMRGRQAPVQPKAGGNPLSAVYGYLFATAFHICCSRGSVVGTATGYGLDDWGIGVRVPVGSRISSSPRRPDRLWRPPNLLSNVSRRLFPRG